MKILLVDDSKTMRNIQKKILEPLGVTEFLEANDGAEAFQLFTNETERVAVVLIDWNMPVMNGITLAAKIREKDKTTALIMTTTEADKSRVLEAIRVGVNNYVVKPFTPEALLEKVRSTIEKQKAAA